MYSILNRIETSRLENQFKNTELQNNLHMCSKHFLITNLFFDKNDQNYVN